MIDGVRKLNPNHWRHTNERHLCVCWSERVSGRMKLQDVTARRQETYSSRAGKQLNIREDVVHGRGENLSRYYSTPFYNNTQQPTQLVIAVSHVAN